MSHTESTLYVISKMNETGTSNNSDNKLAALTANVARPAESARRRSKCTASQQHGRRCSAHQHLSAAYNLPPAAD